MRNPVGTHVLVGKGLGAGAAAQAAGRVPLVLEPPDSRTPDNRALSLLKRLRREARR